MKKESNVFGIASMVCGILSVLIFLMPYFSLPLGAVAIVFYGVQIKKFSPNGLATTGLVTGIIGSILSLGTLLLLLLFWSFVTV